MLRIVVLLEDEIASETELTSGWPEVCFQDTDVVLFFHDAIDLEQAAGTFC